VIRHRDGTVTRFYRKMVDTGDAHLERVYSHRTGELTMTCRRERGVYQGPRGPIHFVYGAWRVLRVTPGDWHLRVPINTKLEEIAKLPKAGEKMGDIPLLEKRRD